MKIERNKIYRLFRKSLNKEEIIVILNIRHQSVKILIDFKRTKWLKINKFKQRYFESNIIHNDSYRDIYEDEFEDETKFKENILTKYIQKIINLIYSIFNYKKVL